jgi:hypothetical protein
MKHCIEAPRCGVLAAAWLVALGCGLSARAQQNPTGPLLIEMNLGEIAANGSAAEAVARSNLGLGPIATLGIGTGLSSDGTNLNAVGQAGAPPLASLLGGTGSGFNVVTVGSGLSLTSGLLTAPGSLPSVTNGQLLANVSGASGVPAGVGASAYLDTIFGSTQGSILYRNSTAWTTLPPGASGQMLEALGAGANVQWASPSFSGVSGSLAGSQMPPLTGDVTSSAGSVATTVGSIGGKAVSLGGTFTTSGAHDLTLTQTAATNITLPTTGTLLTTAGGGASPRVWESGDSRVGIESFYRSVAPYNYAKLGTSALAWAQHFLGSRVSWDLSQGYSGTQQAVLKMNIVPNTQGPNPPANSGLLTAGNGSGTGYSASSTCSSTGGGTYGSPTVDGNGSVLSIPVLTPGSALSAGPIVTCTGGTGLNATGVLGGSGTFGNSGETTCQNFNRLADLDAVAAPGDIVFLRVGGNDDVQGLTLAQSEACMALTFNHLLGRGYFVIYELDLPRQVWLGASNGTAPAPQYRAQIQGRLAWVRQYQQMLLGRNPSLYNHLQILDLWNEVVDTTSAYDNPKTNWLVDGVHDNQLAAYGGGWKLAQIISGWLPNAATPGADYSQAATFSAYNPNGPINTNPAMTGTTGTMPATSGGLTVSGTAPTNYTVITNGTTGTQTLTSSQQTPRVDGLNGTNPRFVVSCGNGGSATQTYIVETGYINFISAGLSNGAHLQLDVDVAISGQSNFIGMSAQENINDTSTVLASSIDGPTGSSGYAPLDNAGVYEYQVPPLDVVKTLHYSTQPVLLNNIGSTSGTQFQGRGYFTFALNCSGAAASAGVTVDFLRFNLHPVQ